MTIFVDILKWSNVLPTWQQDVLQRLAILAAAPDIKDFETGMSVCSTFFAGHLQAIAANEPFPELEDILC